MAGTERPIVATAGTKRLRFRRSSATPLRRNAARPPPPEPPEREPAGSRAWQKSQCCAAGVPQLDPYLENVRSVPDEVMREAQG